MQEIRTTATVSKQKSITIKQLPFAEGEQVDVIIVPQQPRAKSDNPYPLRGMVIQYDQPTEPVAEDDWEALQ